jgi:hypothetical protein
VKKEELRENVIMDESQEKLSLPTNMYLKITYSATKLHYKFTSCLLVSSGFFFFKLIILESVTQQEHFTFN